MGRPESSGTGSAPGAVLAVLKAAETEDFMSDFLAHYGVPGMKWGSRKAPSSAAATHPVSQDHIMVEAHKAVVKTVGVKALSNQDLKRLNERMQLEQTHRELVSKKPGRVNGNAHITAILKTGKTLNEVHGFLNSPIGKVAKKTAKTAGKTAATVGAAAAAAKTAKTASKTAQIAVKAITK